MTVVEIQEYARKEMRHIRTGIKDEFKEEHYNALIYKICELLDELELTKEPNWKMRIDWKDSDYTEYMCPNCGHCKCVLDPYELPPYCESCGTRLLQPEEKEHDDNKY